MITHIVGNRPQFIKLAPLYRELEKAGYAQNIIHSGQHYDQNMSAVFFAELGIPEPYVNLSAGGGSHAQMTARGFRAAARASSAGRSMLCVMKAHSCPAHTGSAPGNASRTCSGEAAVRTYQGTPERSPGPARRRGRPGPGPWGRPGAGPRRQYPPPRRWPWDDAPHRGRTR